MPVLAIDAGGSGSRAALVADDGTVLGVARDGPSPSTLPPAVLQARVTALIGRLGGPGSPLTAVAGFAGAGRPEGAVLAEAALRAALAAGGMSAQTLRITTDAHIALWAVAPETPAPVAVLIAGTGSIALAGRPDGPVTRAGGWGRYLGDEGGGFWLGRRAMEAIGRQADGRSPVGGALAGATLAALGLPDAHALTLAAPHLWADPARVAALAPVVLDLARSGDPEAGELVAQAGAALADILVAARRAAHLAPDAPTGLAGGLWRSPGNPLRAALPAEVAATCRPLRVPPVLGAACSVLPHEAVAVLVRSWEAAPAWVEALA